LKIAPYVERLNKSDECKNLLEKNPDAFIVAGFFVLDFETGKNIHQIDYYLPKEKKVAAFTLDTDVKMQLMDLMNAKKIPEVLDIKTEIDLDALQGILEDEMKNRGFSEKINKIIAVLQMQDGKKIWNLNCILSGMEILRAHVEDESKSVLKMEKIPLTDIMKHLPSGAMGLQGAGKKTGKGKDPSRKELENEMKKLNQIEEKIEEQKEEIKKEISKKKK
jgi:hypothetical protein